MLSRVDSIEQYFQFHSIRKIKVESDMIDWIVIEKEKIATY